MTDIVLSLIKSYFKGRKQYLSCKKITQLPSCKNLRSMSSMLMTLPSYVNRRNTKCLQMIQLYIEQGRA